MDISDAIQEFENYFIHPFMKPTISTEAKCIALKCMYQQLYNEVITDSCAKQIYNESMEKPSERSKAGAEKVINYFKEIDK